MGGLRPRQGVSSGNRNPCDQSFVKRVIERSEYVYLEG